MTYEKAFNYLKELSKTHPKAFKLYSLYRAVNDKDGQAYYLFEFDINLPFTKSHASIVFNINELGDKEFVTNLTDKIDKLILGSDYDELINRLARDKGLLTVNWGLYRAGLEFYLKDYKLTKVSTFFDKVPESSGVDFEGEHLILAEINSLITTPVYRFADFDDFITEINCLQSKTKAFCNKNIVPNFAKQDIFTFTLNFMYKPAHSIVRITKTQGDSFEFPVKYLEHLMPYVGPVVTETNDTTVSYDL